MFRSLRIICVVLVVFAGAGIASGYNFEFTTVSDVVKKVKKTFAEVETYQASFSIVTDKLGKKKYQRGTIKFKAPEKLLVDFSSPYGQKIISDGSRMWIYIPGMNVVADQNLDKDSSSLFSSGTRSGLSRLFAKYHYKFASKGQPVKGDGGKEYYTLFLKQKETRSGYRTIKLWINEEYFVSRAEGETSSGKKVTIEFKNIKTGVNLPNGIFKFDIPSKARVIKNPMLSEE